MLLDVPISINELILSFLPFIKSQCMIGHPNVYGEFYKPRKARFIPTFCKRINRTSTAVGRWVAAFEERRRTTFGVTKFIYNKQGFTLNGTNNDNI